MFRGLKGMRATPRRLLAGLAITTTLLTAVPAQAQVMKPNGWAIPGFFFPAGERRSREACAEERPECRASVRAQMEYEMSISLIIPWVLLGLAVLGALTYARVQERKKEKARLLARARHDPGKFRKLDNEREERPKSDADEEEDI